MTKVEFLGKLREALSNDLTGSVIEENVNYYSQYISDEVSSGKSEEEVISELGDPWVISQTIIDAEENAGTARRSTVYESGEKTYGQTYGHEGNSKRTDMPGQISLWKVILVLLGIIGILVLIVAVIGGIISFIAPVLIPVLVIICVLRFLDRRRRDFH